MAFTSGFNGDHVALRHIIKTIEAKNYLIPGVITNPALSVTASGESSFFYTKGTSTLNASHNLGAGTTGTVKGGKRIDVAMTTGAAFDFIIPGAELQTAASVDVKTAYLIDETQRIINARNEAGLLALQSGAVAKTYAKNKGAYEAILEGLATYKRDNKQSAHKPTGILVSTQMWANLLADNKYIRSTDRADLKVYDGQVLEIAGTPIIEAVDLVGADFILVNSRGFAAPMNIHAFKMVPADFGGGVAYINGERGLGYPLKA